MMLLELRQFGLSSLGGTIASASVFGLGYLAYMFSVFTFVRTARRALGSHMEMLHDRNLDPVSTPTFKKQQMYATVEITTVCGVTSALFGAKLIEFWHAKVFSGSFRCIMQIVICFKFRMRNSMEAAYSDADQAHRVESTDCEVEWSSDIVLPHIPQLRGKARKIDDGDEQPAQE
jgi:hypothetical protein